MRFKVLTRKKNQVSCQLSKKEKVTSLALKDELQRKLREEEIKWRQSSRCHQLNEMNKTQGSFMGWHQQGIEATELLI